VGVSSGVGRSWLYRGAAWSPYLALGAVGGAEGVGSASPLLSVRGSAAPETEPGGVLNIADGMDSEGDRRHRDAVSDRTQ
jgi:hypothetical protein